MKDFVRPGENGLLAPVGDARGLAEAVLRLVCDPALADRLGAQAQRDVRAYTWERSAHLLLGAYTAAARGRRPARPELAS
jgi:glycosyltransferase involved in cell wall biosynthesis